MVLFGDPREASPVFDSNCIELGTSRWLDDRNWVFDFKQNLDGGTECTFTLRSDVVSLQMKTYTGSRSFSFSTGGVNILRSQPWNGYFVDEDQAYILLLDGKVKEDSLRKELYFLSSTLPGKTGIEIIKGSLRDEILKQNYYTKDELDYIYIIQPKMNFAPESKIKLFWSKNIESKTGVKNNQDQVMEFKVRSQFKVSFYCERENADKNCIPFSDMELRFSSAIPSKFVKSIFLKDKDGKNLPAEFISDYDKNSNTTNSVKFSGPFPEKSEFTIHLPDLKDEANRNLANAKNFPLKVKTEPYPPLAKFASHFGILEAKASPILPVTIRNLEAKTTGKIISFHNQDFTIANIKKWLRLSMNTKRDRSMFQSETIGIRNLELPKTQNDGSMEVVGIPLLKPGFYAVEINSRILGNSLLAKDTNFYVPSTALITNLSIHLKWGRESSLVWVTELSSGKPMGGVSIEIQDCKGKIYVSETTNEEGILNISNLPFKDSIPYCSYKSYDNGLFVMAKKDNDASFLHSSWNGGIETWRFNLPYASFPNEKIAHTILDRSLFRAGETVSMKHILRKHSMKGFVSPDIKTAPKYLAIVHDGSEDLVNINLKWNYPGYSLSEWKIPKTAKLGSYTLYLTSEPNQKWGQFLGNFRVEEFRLPVLKASISSPKSIWVNESLIPVTLQASYLAGGPASKLPVDLKYRIIPSSFTPRGFEKFSFAASPIEPGRLENYEAPAKIDYMELELELDKNGIKDEKIEWKDKNSSSLLQMEMSFLDPNGEIQSISSRINLLPASTLVGIASDFWSMNQADIQIRTVVVDGSGKGIASSQVEVEAFKYETFSHRKRLVGGFYAYESYSEIKKIGSVCKGSTDANGFFLCKSKDFPESGEFVFQAKSVDSSGKTSYTNVNLWIAGKSDWWYAASDHDRMDVIPDKDNYKMGESIKLQVKAPFRDYTALVTIEREGIIKSYLRSVDSKNPFITIPADREFIPNAFISVLAVRGRVDSPKETAMVDLARPSFRLGITEIKVGWEPHQLFVKVATDKQEYKTRSKAKININVTDFQGKAITTGGEVALAVVDEALLELAGNPSWDLLAAMMGRRGYEIDTYSANMQIVGKRHFGRKAIPAGGGGGNLPTRELFDTLLKWQGRIALDKNGQASLEIPLKDSLTSYRVIAVASAGVDLFGTGSANFASTQDILIFSSLPPVVRNGDQFSQEYTVKNNTKETKKLQFELEVDGVKFPMQVISLQASETKRVAWDVLVDKKIDQRISKLNVIENGTVIDAIKTVQKVTKSIPIRVLQGTLSQIDNEYNLLLAAPKDAIQGDSSLEINLSSSIIGSADGIKKYMKDYPYSCMEQKVSKAIVSENAEERSSLNSEIGNYLDSDGLVKYFPSSIFGDEILTAYILSITNEAGWMLPDDARNKMIIGLNRFLDGTLVRQRGYNFADQTYRKLQVMEALSRYSALNEDRLSSVLVDVKIWPTASVLDLVSILKRLPTNSERSKQLKEAESNLRARLNLQGREMNLASTQSSLWWMMGSADQDASRFISYALDTESYNPDLGKMARSFVARMKDGKFSNTLANTYAYLSLKKFASTQEKEKVAGITNTKLVEMLRTTEWKDAAKEEHNLEFSLASNKEQNLQIKHNGSGKPWASIQVKAAVPLKKDWDNGISIRKTIQNIEKKNLLGGYSVGDIVRVKIQWELSAPRTWVVIDDAIPAGSTILGSGLGSDSQAAIEGEIQADYWATYQERSFSGFKSYYEYLPAGKYSLEYTFRLNTQGKFELPPTRAEAMYSPDIFGETPNATWSVLP